MSKPAPKMLIFNSSEAAGIAVLNLFFTERKLGLFLVLDKEDF
ncbi:hypothetical protein [Methanosarcina sp. MTP4]|nr:hypothetical protein [Methanosarcina sp. MTP4]